MLNKNNSKIGNESNNNIVLQGNSVSGSVINGSVYIDSMDDTLSILTDNKNYSAIQALAKHKFDAFGKSHPLYPDFTAEFNAKLKRLVSTPQTDEALKKFPRKLKGTYKIDIKDFPGMDKTETILEYAYRTQQKLELEPSAFQEYLGDDPDPYPEIEYHEGMKTIISPPKFPEAVDASIVSDDISLSLKLKRIPCLQFGMVIFEGTPIGHSINLKLKHNLTEKKLTANIECNPDTSLIERLAAEKFLNGILKTKKLTIKIGANHLCTMSAENATFDEPLYTESPYLIRYIENLLTIQEATACIFDPVIKEVMIDDYNTAFIMARSIQGEWYGVKKEFDNELRGNYDCISEDILNTSQPDFEELVVETPRIEIELQGQSFVADKYIIAYCHGRINNLKSVRKNCNKKRNRIMITIKPQKGKRVFYKYSKFGNLQHLDKANMLPE